MNLLLVTEQMLILFGMMAAGFLLWRIKWIDQNTFSRLSSLVVNIFNPFLTIYSVFGKSLATTGKVFWENLFLVGLFYVILTAAGFLIVFVIRPDSAEAPVYRMLTLLPNCGFMGIPVVSSLLGTDYVIYVAIYMLVYNIIMYTYGIHLVRKSNPHSAQDKNIPLWHKVRPIVLNPGFLSAVLALVLFFTGIPVPEGIQQFCGYMGNPCVPLSMMLIGCSVASANIGELTKDLRRYGFLFIKMLLVPIAFTFFIRLLPFDDMILKLFIIMLSMPAGSMVVLITQEYGGKTDCAAAGVVSSTIVSLLTIPIVTLFL